VFVGLKNVNVKQIQVGLQNTITWTKKFKEGKQQWEHSYFESGM
jgi:hypothetical protein